MTDASKPRILLFCRPYLVPDFRANFDPLSERYDFFLLTDGRSKGVADTREEFYRLLKARSRPQILTAEEAEDCIMRCRLLRNLERSDAQRRLEAMAATLDGWFERVRPSLTISHPVDDYVTHVLSILSRRRGIQYVAYSASFFPGHIQLLSYESGVPFRFRAPDAAEAEEMMSSITRARFRQNYGQAVASYSFARHVQRVARYCVKRVYFATKGILERDRLQAHYALTPFIAERRSLLDYPASRLFERDWRSALSALGDAPVIYMPLGYFPESTIDYWTSDRSILDYEEKVLEMARSLGRRFRLLVKEHPHMVGVRSPRFYGALATIPNVVLAGPFEYSSDIMEAAAGVVLGGGSGGVEAVLFDRPVFTFCDTIYWYKPSGARFLDLRDIGGWAKVIAEGLKSYRPMTPAEKLQFLATCLESTVLVRPGGRRWPLTDTRQMGDAIDHALKANQAETALANP